MITKKEFLNLISNNDKEYAKIYDLLLISYKNWSTSFSDFLTPTDVSKITTILKKIPDFDFRFFGGFSDCERQILAIFPKLEEVLDTDFPISCVKIAYNKKFATKEVTHREYLGSILGLGINRSKVGDIFILENEAFVFLDVDIANFVEINLTKVSRTTVKCEIVSLHSVVSQLAVEEKFVNITVSSMRLDVIVSKVFNIARSQSKALILKEKVFVNWECVSSTKDVKEDDVITVRGTGRCKVGSVNGITKNGKISITILKYT